MTTIRTGETFADLLRRLSDDENGDAHDHALRVGDTIEINGSTWLCTHLGEDGIELDAVPDSDVKLPGDVLMFSGAQPATEALLQQNGVPVLSTVYQKDISTPENGKPSRFIHMEMVRHVFAGFPADSDAVVHVNWEHERVVSNMAKHSVDPWDNDLMHQVSEFETLLHTVKQTHPRLRVGNWGYFMPEKWIPASVEKQKSGVRTYGNIAGSDKRRLLDKWRHPNFASLWRSLGAFMPAFYRSHDYRTSSYAADLYPAWIDASMALVNEVRAEHNPDAPVVVSMNVRFSGHGRNSYFGRAIPRDQLAETIRMVMARGWIVSPWGIDAASTHEPKGGWNGYWFDDGERGEKYREATLEELADAGVDATDHDAVRAYFAQWAADLSLWFIEEVKRNLPQQPTATVLSR